MRPLFLFAALFISCSQPAKIVTKPELGMQLSEFQALCGYDPIDAKTVTNEQGDTLTVTYKPTNYNGEPKAAGCGGTFTFVNGKLTQINH